MPIPAVTYSFSNGTTSDGPQVSTNFSDLISALTDGTKDLTINNLTTNGTVILGSSAADTLTINATVADITSSVTISGAVVMNGAVTLGDTTADVITIGGRIAGDLTPTTNAARVMGTSALCWTDLFLDNGATDGGQIHFNGSTTSSLTCSADGATYTIGTTVTSVNGTKVKNFAKGWVNYDHTATSITDSVNVTSVTNNGPGDLTVNWTTPFADANYYVGGSAQGNGVSHTLFFAIRSAGVAAGSVRCLTFCQQDATLENAKAVRVEAMGAQ